MVWKKWENKRIIGNKELKRRLLKDAGMSQEQAEMKYPQKGRDKVRAGSQSSLGEETSLSHATRLTADMCQHQNPLSSTNKKGHPLGFDLLYSYRQGAFRVSVSFCNGKNLLLIERYVSTPWTEPPSHPTPAGVRARFTVSAFGHQP